MKEDSLYALYDDTVELAKKPKARLSGLLVTMEVYCCSMLSAIP